MLPRAFVQSQKTEVHAPGFLEFAKQIPLNTCAKRTKKARQRRAFRVSAHKCAETLSPAVFRLCRNRQGRRTAVRRIKFPVKVGACT